MDDIEMNVSDIILRVLLRWRFILICVAVGAVLLNSYAVFKSASEAKRIGNLIREYNEKLESEDEEEDDGFETQIIELQEFEESLTERQISEVQSIVSMYKMFQKPYSDTVEYINNSIKMQIDSNAVPTLVVQYIVDTHFSVTYPEIAKRDYTSDILNSIFYRLLNDKTLAKMSAVLGEDIDPVYAKELIGTWTSGDDIYCINAIGRDRAECEALMEVIKEAFPSVMEELQKIYGSFDYQQISEEYYELFSQDILNAQQSQADKLKTLRNTANDLISVLNEEQKTYFYALLNNDETVTLELPVEKDTPDEEIIDPSTLEVPAVRYLHKKYLLLGAILGSFLACVYVFFRIVLRGTLISAENIEKAYEVSLLGGWRISESSTKLLSGIDEWLIHLFDGRGSQFSPAEHLSMVVAGIRMSAAKNNWKNVYVTGTANDTGTQEVIHSICDALTGQVEKVSCGKSVVYDPESLEAINNSDVAVLVERTDVSRYDEIRTEFSLCKQHQVPIMGYVVLK